MLLCEWNLSQFPDYYLTSKSYTSATFLWVSGSVCPDPTQDAAHLFELRMNPTLSYPLKDGTKELQSMHDRCYNILLSAWNSWVYVDDSIQWTFLDSVLIRRHVKMGPQMKAEHLNLITGFAPWIWWALNDQCLFSSLINIPNYMGNITVLPQLPCQQLCTLTFDKSVNSLKWHFVQSRSDFISRHHTIHHEYHLQTDIH